MTWGGVAGVTGCQYRQKAGYGAGTNVGTATSHTVRRPDSGTTYTFLVRAMAELSTRSPVGSSAAHQAPLQAGLASRSVPEGQYAISLQQSGVSAAKRVVRCPGAPDYREFNDMVGNASGHDRLRKVPKGTTVGIATPKTPAVSVPKRRFPRGRTTLRRFHAWPPDAGSVRRPGAGPAGSGARATETLELHGAAAQAQVRP